MSPEYRFNEAGGFLPPVMPTLSSSNANLPSTSSILPHARSHPLKPGSSKESSFINYVDQKLLAISRRYELRSNPIADKQPTLSPEDKGYKDFGAVATDLDTLVDVVWVSGSRSSLTNECAMQRDRTLMMPPSASLQTPYFLTIALALSSYMISFPFFPQPTFRLLRKLDVVFASLLRGLHVQTGVTLPGFNNGRGKVRTTEQVRIKGLVERTRIAVVEVAGKDGRMMMDLDSACRIIETEDDFTADSNETMEESTNDETTPGFKTQEGSGNWEMDVARVYERTIVELGLSLDSFGAGDLD